MQTNSTLDQEEVSIDHQKVWRRLREEIHNLIDKGIQQIPPVVVLGYMDFLEQIEETKGRE